MDGSGSKDFKIEDVDQIQDDDEIHADCMIEFRDAMMSLARAHADSAEYRERRAIRNLARLKRDKSSKM